MADEPFKSSPSGLRSVKQSLEIRSKVRALTERISKGNPPAPAPLATQPDEHELEPLEPKEK